MPSPAWENLDDFLQVDDFAVPAVITLQNLSTVSLNVIFDDPYLNAETGEYQADTSEPRILCKESDVVAVTRGDSVLVGGKTYDILTAFQSDGTGMAFCRLAPT